MTKVLTTTKVQAIVKDMEKALKELEEKHGVKISKSGNISFTEADFNVKFKVEIDDPRLLTDRERNMFKLYAEIENFNPDGFGQSFKDKDLVLTVVGFNSRAPKNPIVLKDQHGKQYKMPLIAYKNMFPIK